MDIIQTGNVFIVLARSSHQFEKVAFETSCDAYIPGDVSSRVLRAIKIGNGHQDWFPLACLSH